MNIEDLKYNVDHGSYYDKPAHALMLSICLRYADYGLSVKYASLAVEMLDSLDPSDLIGPYKEFIADHREFARDVYVSIIDDKYKFDAAYQNSLNLYRAEQSDEENKQSDAAARERRKIISYFYK